jgi:glycosyltransferase involved in cell wall biosynthesis
MKNVAIISNYAHSLVAFRSHLIEDLIDKGYQVYALAPDYTEEYRNHLNEIGATTTDIYMDRTGYNPIKDIGSLFNLIKIIRKINPDITFSYGIKPVVYGLWASYIAGVEKRYAMVAGLGTLYVEKEAETLKDSVSRTLADLLYRFSLPLADKVFFQNPDDISLFEDKGFVNGGESVLLNGSGVDLGYYHTNHIQKNPITFTLVARLIKEKGVYEFIDSARIIRNKYPTKDIKFILIGDVDSNPNSVERKEI